MPGTPTYPGVYIEEVPAGVRPIEGVATSITAFVGRAARGPVDEVVAINNFQDFDRIFGGLWRESWLGYAVRDFFWNGGVQAVIVRLFNPTFADEATSGTIAELSVNGLELRAANPGAWGNHLRAIIDHDASEEVATTFGLTKSDLFNLTVSDTKTGVTEHFPNLTVADSPGKADKVLESKSQLVRAASGALPAAIPRAHEKPEAGKDPFESDTTSSKVTTTASDGEFLTKDSFIGNGKEAAKKGLYVLEQADLFNLLCIPPYRPDSDIDPELIDEVTPYCEKRRALFLIDPPKAWDDMDKAKAGVETMVGRTSRNAALYFPRLRQRDPLRDDQFYDFVPCGAVAGVIARTDTKRGVWKAPAGIEASLLNVSQLSVNLTNAESGELNPIGINCLRTLPTNGHVVWGSRTRVGDDGLAPEWKYIPVCRTALFIEESLYRGTQWVVFEPNDEPLWAQIRLSISAFLAGLFRQGAFQGGTPRDAYFVKCDEETTTQDDINRGIVNIVVGYAPLKPAEFVIIKLQQLAGQILV